MDTTYLPDWNTDVEGQVPVHNQRRQLGLENELAELLWQHGEVVLRSQTRQKTSPVVGNLMTNLIQDDEPISWIHCPVDEAFGKEFYSNFSSGNQLSGTFQADKESGSTESEKSFKISVSDDVNHVYQISQQPTFASPPRFETFESAHRDHSSGFVRKTGSSLCGSNQIASSCGIGRTLSAGLNDNHTRNISPQSDNRERETHDQAILSSYGGSGSSLCKTSNQSNDNNCHKRKSRNVKESECPNDATEFESASGDKSSQKSGTTRRSHVAEVHNLSERRRRDRINEKMRALQELIPHSNKSDKASMLDEAIEYMKSLQSQIQLLWMGSGMAPMMLPGMQQFMPRTGMGIGPMHLSRMPLIDQAMAMNQATVGLRPVLNPMNYQNQVQNPGFAEQYANYMALCSMQNTSQPMNMFGFGSHSSQQNHVAAPPGNGKGSVP